MRRDWLPAIGFALLVCGAAGHANGADLTLPPPAPASAPAFVPVPVYNWSGFFVGGHLGYGWTSEAITLVAPGDYSAREIAPAIAADPHGFLGGVQYGTNWQFG